MESNEWSQKSSKSSINRGLVAKSDTKKKEIVWNMKNFKNKKSGEIQGQKAGNGKGWRRKNRIESNRMQPETIKSMIWYLVLPEVSLPNRLWFARKWSWLFGMSREHGGLSGWWQPWQKDPNLQSVRLIIVYISQNQSDAIPLWWRISW